MASQCDVLMVAHTGVCRLLAKHLRLGKSDMPERIPTSLLLRCQEQELDFKAPFRSSWLMEIVTNGALRNAASVADDVRPSANLDSIDVVIDANEVH